MTRTNKIKKIHAEELEAFCSRNGIDIVSVVCLLDAEKTKKLFKRNALIQQTIDREIENSIQNENR